MAPRGKERQLLAELKGAATALAVVVAALLVTASGDLGFIGEGALQALRFHIGALLVLVAIGLFAMRAWRRGLLFLLVAVAGLGIGGIDLYRQQFQRSEAAARGTTRLLTMMSFNILGSNVANGERIASYVAGSGADIVLLMEAGPVSRHLDLVEPAYPNRVGCDGTSGCDTLLLSKVPLIDVNVRSLGPANQDRLITATATFGDHPITIVAVHLVKPYFDYLAQEEVRQLISVLKKIEGPLLLAGDFNAPVWSNDLRSLVSHAKLIPGPDYPATWPVQLGPLGIPIDNIFTRAPLVITGVESISDPMGSNHRGLVAEVALAGQ